MSRLLICLLLAAGVSAHGVILKTKGANGVVAPGACVLDGTPRDCIVNACGAQADAGIIRDAEIDQGKYGPLGWTQGGGNCKPDAVISSFMGLGSAPTYKGGRKKTGPEDDLSALGIKGNTRRRVKPRLTARDSAQGESPLNLPGVGVAGLGGERTSYPEETIVGDMAGQGKMRGLPTTNDNGEISLVYRQDGAGPLTAAIDSTSAATDPKAFQSAKLTYNVPGDGVFALSFATSTNFDIKVQMPEGVVCEGKVAGLDNVCFVQVRNQAPAGPFGGAGFFTQSSESRKRAVAFRKRSLSK
ncbi:hypothetical protein C2857_002954 [Epichloe festucae Fl1]|uniref:Cell surface protein n=1 Tax=Epichloe festucae (strain Fl1) TaxID=877507 RepID=A0A7S9KNW6_EPIFF|nr:hypothetical protein C2857_002954 [Epichloe festucae Fl1]